MLDSLGRPYFLWDCDLVLADFLATDAYPTCFPDDPHWNAEGHRIAAEAIARELGPIIESRLQH